MAGIFGGVLAEAFRPARPSDLEDESVGSFFTRRFNRNLTENLLSALLHGIYAGDIDSLSVKSLFPSAWRNEAVHGSLIRGLFAWSQTEIAEDQKLRNELHTDNAELLEKLKDGSVFSFKGGIETLSKALVRDLEACKNVTIKRDVDVRELKYVQSPDDLSLEVVSPSAYMWGLSTDPNPCRSAPARRQTGTRTPCQRCMHPRSTTYSRHPHASPRSPTSLPSPSASSTSTSQPRTSRASTASATSYPRQSHCTTTRSARWASSSTPTPRTQTRPPRAPSSPS